MEKLYTVEDVASLTGLTNRTIRTYIKEGLLTGKKIGVQWRFTEDDIEKLFTKKDINTKTSDASNENLLLFQRFLDCNDDTSNKICMVWDCPVVNVYDLEHTCLSILSDFNDEIEDEKVFFSYEYFESTMTSRFLLNGRSEIVFRMLQMIQSELFTN